VHRQGANPAGEAVTTATFMPDCCRLHAPSWEPRNADALAREVEVIHLPITSSRWPAGGPLWAREQFCNRRRAGMVAYSVDHQGRIVRGWFTNAGDQAAYKVGGFGQFGPVTAPIEAVALEYLQPGVPGIPAHLLIGAQRDWPGYRDALSRITCSEVAA
jgi:hypothetical protein